MYLVQFETYPDIFIFFITDRFDIISNVYEIKLWFYGNIQLRLNQLFPSTTRFIRLSLV